MKVLVINCGSSSLKYQLIDMQDESVLAKGLVERIYIDGSKIVHQVPSKDKVTIEKPMPDHETAIKLVLDCITDKEIGVISDVNEIDAIGHRVVHGGAKYSDSIVITEDVKKGIQDVAFLSPLHNPANLMGINAVEKAMPGKANIAVFDTSFGVNMPEKAYRYAIPHKYYEKYGIRRYGFHGTSHKFVSGETIDFLGLNPDTAKVIVCHLGNGASISASIGGKCVDSSMGLTPLEGLIMGTRSGDIDPSFIQIVCERENLTVEQAMNILNKESGVLGISDGLSSDFRDIEIGEENGNPLAKLALEAFRYRIIKYVGAYMAAMGGLDAIAFTGGVGENDKFTRKIVSEAFAFMGVKIDDAANDVRGKKTLCSTPDSTVKVVLMPTNEELAIARETKRLTV